MFHIQLDDSDDDGGSPKRLKLEQGQPKVLIDLTNSQSQDVVGPTERQQFFDSQYYKTNDNGHKRRTTLFPGPAGIKKRASKGKKSGKPDENKNVSRQSLFKDVTFTCSPSDNSTWKAIKDLYDLHYQDKNSILNKINIRTIQDKLKRVNPVEGRTAVPFLAAVIVDDGGIGRVRNEEEKMSCFSIILEDLTGTITALLDTKVVLHLGHLLRVGSSIILKDPEFHKIYGDPQISITTKMISCVAVDTKFVDLKIWRDTPDSFWPKMLENDIIIFEQRKLEADAIHKEIADFENKIKITRRSLSSTPSTSAKSNPAGTKNWIRFTDQKGKNYQKINVSATESNDVNMIMAGSSSIISSKSTVNDVISGEFEDKWDDDFIDSSMIELADKLEMDINGKNTTSNNVDLSENKSSLKDSFSDQQKSNQIVGEFDDDSDEDFLNTTMIKVAEQYEVKQNHAVASIDENSTAKCQGTYKEISGEFHDCSDDDDQSLVQELEKFEKKSLLKENADNQKLALDEQADDVKINDRIVGEFDDKEDDEMDSILINAMNDSIF